MSEKILMKGNEAFACAAILHGCRYYFGYPITPQNELIEYMSRELEKVGGSFVQAESETAAISMAYGAACAGGKVLISSASPGIALMQEGISFFCSAELPVVIINVSRGGPGIGTIQPGQSDYFQATRGGGNGDYRVIVYAPASIQESIDLVGKSYEVAEEYRNPVMILADGMVGQMMEAVVLPKSREAIDPENIETTKPWAITGHKNKRPQNVIRSLFINPQELEDNINRYWSKYEKVKKELTDFEAVNIEDAEIVLVAYGSTSRIVEEALDLLSQCGIKAGLIRPITLWPYPYEAFDKIGKNNKTVLSVELSQGQMLDDVLIGVKGRWPVSLANRVGGMLITPHEVAEAAKKALKEAK